MVDKSERLFKWLSKFAIGYGLQIFLTLTCYDRIKMISNKRAQLKLIRRRFVHKDTETCKKESLKSDVIISPPAQKIKIAFIV